MKNPDCPKCHGKMTYMYDENHGTICDLCCDHDNGWWKLREHYGSNNGKWSCLTGCGKIITWARLVRLIRDRKAYFISEDDKLLGVTYSMRGAQDMRKSRRRYDKTRDIQISRNPAAWADYNRKKKHAR